MSDVFFEDITRGQRAAVSWYVARGDRVWVFDFSNRLMTRPWLRRLINAGRVRRVYIPVCTREEGQAFDAAEWLYPRVAADDAIVAALRRAYGDESEAVVRQAILLGVFRFLYMHAYLQRHTAGANGGRPVLLVSWNYEAWARALADWPALGPAPARLSQPRILGAWARIAARGETLLRTAKAAATAGAVLLTAALRRRRAEAAAPLTVDHVYAVDQPFQTKFKGVRQFHFLLEGRRITRESTAFVVHPSAEGSWIESARQEGYQVIERRPLATLRGLLRHPPRSVPVGRLVGVLAAVVARPAAPSWLIEAALIGVRTYLEVANVFERVRFANYVYTNQDGLDQRYQNILIRRFGGEAWYFALSIGGGYLNGEGGDLAPIRDPASRHRLYAYQNPDHFVLTSDHAVAYHRDHHHQWVRRYHNVGNIWSELILRVPPADAAALRREWFGAAVEHGRVVSWFDTTFVEEEYSPALFAEAVAWYDDIERLLDEDESLFAVIKPSKAAWFFTDEAFQWYHPKGRDVLAAWERISRHPRAHFAGHEGDSAAIIAASDLTVTFCFSSCTAEALAARRRGLWYEPKRRWTGTLYDVSPLLVAHGYDELRKVVRTLLDDMKPAEYDTFLDETVRGLVEDHVDGRGLSRLQTLLADAAGARPRG